MKIAIVTDMTYPFYIGGSEVRNYKLARELSKKHDVHFVCVKLWKGKSTIKKNGFTYHGVCRYRSLYNFSGKRRSFEPIWFMFWLNKFFKKNKFDVVDCISFPYFPAFSVAKSGCKFLITWHEVWLEYWKEYLGWRGFSGEFIERKVSKLASVNVGVSDLTTKRLKKIGAKGVKTVYNAVDIDEISKAKPHSKKFDVCYCGRLFKHKNVDLLIKSMQFVKGTLAIAGTGPEEELLKKLVAKLGLNDRVSFLGYMPKMSQVFGVMKSSKVFVSPSSLEGFGITLIEAMACKKPVVTINAPRNAGKDVVKNVGFVVKKDANSLARVLNKLLKDNKLRSFLGKKGYAEVKKKYSYSVMGREYEKIYKEVVLK
jgi:glycosyltransferase involved in cell wall biosynthesis